jgi:hypothetical protein
LLAPDGAAPTTGSPAAVLQALAWTLDRLHGSGVRAIGRVPFMTVELFDGLCDEARAARPAQATGARRTTGDAGYVLAAVAVSRELREAVSDALGFDAVPTYRALYEYDGPGSLSRLTSIVATTHLCSICCSTTRGPKMPCSPYSSRTVPNRACHSAFR